MAVVLFVFVAAIVGVVLGIVLKGNRKDRGLMVREGKPLRWSPALHVIEVWFHPLLDVKWFAAFLRARLILNIAIGRQFIDQGEIRQRSEPWEPLPLGCLFFAPGREGDKFDDLHAYTEHEYEKTTGHIVTATVTLLPDAKGFHDSIMLHEMGHVLGLDHDEAEDSIMFPSTVARPQGLSQADTKLLKATYAKGSSIVVAPSEKRAHPKSPDASE